MIHFEPVPEPPQFDRKARKPGLAWLAAHPHAERPKGYWSAFKPHLADGFGNLCGYAAMYEPVGTVDHYISYRTDPSKAYEWSNYRYASQWINSSKGTADAAVLDPFEVQDGWFEVLLPSLQLVLTQAVPAGKRQRAEYTLKRLHLRDDERVIRQRRAWYELYQTRKLTLEGLADRAPLLPRAVQKSNRSSKGEASEPEP